MRNRNEDWVERQIKTLQRDIASMEENNDGSLNWVDEIRDMYSMIDDLERMLARKDQLIKVKHSSQVSKMEGKKMMIELLEEYNGNEIVIISGEGESGTISVYDGKATKRDILSRLAVERSGGDRWAKAYIFAYENDGGKVYMNLENPSELKHI